MLTVPNASFDVSILIVNYKTPYLILDCLRSVAAHTSGITYEVLVVDNASGDNSRTVVLAEFPEVRWLDMGYNAGFSRANNLAIDHARGRNLLLLNSDTLLRDNLLARCVRLLDTQPDVAAVGAMQITREGKIHQDIFDTFGKIRRHFYILPPHPFFRKLLYRLVPDTHYPDPNEVDWLSGAFIMTRPETVTKAGKLNESFFMYGEDVEWGYRLSQQGRLLMLRDAAFVHLEYGSSEEYQKHEVTWINRFKTQQQVSQLLWIRKQYGIMAYVVLIIHYLIMIPVVYVWKLSINLRNRQKLFADLANQQAFAQQVGVFLRFFWKTLFNRPGFYKV